MTADLPSPAPFRRSGDHDPRSGAARWSTAYSDDHRTGLVGALRRRVEHWRIPSFVEPMLHRIGPGPHETLDLACGGGWAFLRRFGPVVGLDRRLTVLPGAARTYGRAVQSDAAHLPFPDESFDVVFNCWFFEHLDEAAFVSVLREIRRVLRPGGHLIAVADLHSSKWLLRWARRSPRLYAKTHVDALGHHGLRTLELNRHLLRREGFGELQTVALDKSNLLQPVTASWMFDNELGRRSKWIHAYARLATWIRDRPRLHSLVYVPLTEVQRVFDRVLPDDRAFTAIFDRVKLRTERPVETGTEPRAESMVAAYATTTTDAVADPSAAPHEPRIDPWSGLPTETPQRRPVAVMVDNAPRAFPQEGLARATLVIQAPLERAHTRLLAVFSHASPRVGPIRSARPYFLDWAAAFEPFLVHCGASPDTDALLRRPKELLVVELRYERIAGEATFTRNAGVARLDPDRKSPHQVFADVTQIFDAPEQLDLVAPPEFRALARHDPAQFLRAGTHPRHGFDEPEDLGQPVAQPATRIDVRIWPRCRFAERFRWDGERRGFTRQPLALGIPIPGSSDPDLLIRNLVVLRTDVEEQEASLRRRRRVRTLGHGTAQLWRGPAVEQVSWHKVAPDYTFEFRDEGGRLVVLRPGLTWICVLGADGEVRLSP